MMSLAKRSLCVLLVGVFATMAISATPSSSQPWPQRAVRVIVPIGPGTAPDFVARVFAERLAERWSRAVVIENRPGTDGIVGATGFAAARDDHTLLFSFGGPITIAPLVHDKLPYDPVRDLVPIAAASDLFLTVTVPETLNVRTIAELVRLARSRPGKLNWFGAPGLPEIVFAGFNKSADLDMVRVSYRDVTQAVVDVTEARLQVMSSALTPVLPQIRAAKVRALLVNNRERTPILPDVPTAEEAGFPELSAAGVLGFFGWRDMPTSLRDRIADDIREVAAEPGVRARLENAGQIARGSTPAEFTSALDAQRSMVAAVVRAVGTLRAQSGPNNGSRP